MLVLVAAFIVCSVTDWARAVDDGDPILVVDTLSVHFARQVTGLPSIDEIRKLNFRLELSPEKFDAGDGQSLAVYQKVGKGHAGIDFSIESLSQMGLKGMHVSAIREITDRITKHINSLGFVVVQAQPDSAEIDPTDNTDKRNASKEMHLVIYMGVVSEVRSVASGNRVPKENRVDNPLHRATTQNSPVTPEPGKSLIRKDMLDSYVFSLNRQPGRRVDLAVSQADPARPGYQQGDVVLDYLISESKPWSVIIQGSNTGTAETSEWRERFGFTNNEFTNHDDIFSINYTTSTFDGRSQDVEGSYDVPVGKTHKLRAKVYGSFDQFTASDLGSGLENFKGSQGNAAAELTCNVYQKRDKFIDIFGGGQYSHISANLNPLAATASTGQADFAEPYIGVRAEADTDTATTSGSVTFRYGMPFDRHTSSGRYEGPAGLDQLGRAGASGNFPLLQADVSQSFFIEPLLWPADFTLDPSSESLAGPTRSSLANRVTLANEMVFSARGQYSGGQRLVPQEQEAVGGLYSVHGYPESFVAGDTVVIGSAEYRLHVPRLFKVQPNPDQTPLLGRPFRWSPQQSLGRPDWDLIGRVFFDAGYAHSYQGRSTLREQQDEVLLGTGVGIETQLSPEGLPTVDLRADWGVALHDAFNGSQTAHSGGQRFSFVFTLMF